jgi:hypothetical protein
VQRIAPLVRPVLVAAEGAFRRPVVLVVAAVVVVAVAFLGGALTERSMRASPAEPGTEPTARPHVVVYGDSLVVQSEPYLEAVGRSLGLEVTPRAVGGIAPCDALGWLAGDLERSVPDIVVFAFSGNSLTECMQAPDGSLAVGDDITTKYRSDIEFAIKLAANAGTPLVLASPPATQQSPESWERFDALYRELTAAHAPYVQYTDAGLDIAPSGRFSTEQRCLPFELEISMTKEACGSGDRTISVRAGDGTHFCGDVVTGSPGTCASYSSGAIRYAIALVTAAKLDLDYVEAMADIAPRRLG